MLRPNWGCWGHVFDQDTKIVVVSRTKHDDCGIGLGEPMIFDSEGGLGLDKLLRREATLAARVLAGKKSSFLKLKYHEKHLMTN